MCTYTRVCELACYWDFEREKCARDCCCCVGNAAVAVADVSQLFEDRVRAESMN